MGRGMPRPYNFWDRIHAATQSRSIYFQLNETAQTNGSRHAATVQLLRPNPCRDPKQKLLLLCQILRYAHFFHLFLGKKKRL